MPNMPTITRAEIAVVAAAIVVLYVIPFVLASMEAFRRRRAHASSDTFVAHEALAGASPDALLPGPCAETARPFAEPPAPTPDAAGDAPSPAHPNGAADRESESAGGSHPLPPGLLGADMPAVESPAASPTAIIPDTDGTAAPAFEPFTAEVGYQFRLEDLHRVRLPDCATTARTQLWRDGERVAEAHYAAILAATLLSPYPVRSACLDAVEQEGWRVRLHYLLFPSLWPVSREQAAAQAIFDIDTASGTVAPHVHALRPSDLNEDTRRAIRDSGGEI